MIHGSCQIGHQCVHNFFAASADFFLDDACSRVCGPGAEGLMPAQGDQENSSPAGCLPGISRGIPARGRARRSVRAICSGSGACDSKSPACSSARADPSFTSAGRASARGRAPECRQTFLSAVANGKTMPKPHQPERKEPTRSPKRPDRGHAVGGVGSRQECLLHSGLRSPTPAPVMAQRPGRHSCAQGIGLTSTTIGIMMRS